MEKATRHQIKEQNRNLVLKTIFERSDISRAEIARVTRLTRTTVSDIVSDLLDERLVKEVGTGSSLGGKSPILLDIAADSRYLIGLDLARNKFSGAIVNLRGQICAFVSRPIKECNREAALQTTCEIIDHLIGPGLPTHQPLVGIGIGAPGLINSKDGVVINAVNLDWVNLPLGKLLEERYHLPVCLLNDCQAAAMGEYIYAADLSEARNMVVVRVGHGIGAGIIINGQIFQGDGGSAGEIGHIVVTTDQTLSCRCGNVGCLETLASANALVQRAELAVMRIPPYPQPTALAKHAGSITLELIEQAFAEGDALAQEIVLEAGRYLGIALANLISTLNIHKIILIGDMACFGQPWLAAIQETMSQATLGRLAQETSVQIGDLKDNDVILGVSALMASNYSLLFQKQ